MINFQKSAARSAEAAALALVATLAVGSLTLLAGLTVAAAASVFAVLLYVAFAAQFRPFDDGNRLVYRPVYVRARNVHRRVSSNRD